MYEACLPAGGLPAPQPSRSSYYGLSVGSGAAYPPQSGLWRRNRAGRWMPETLSWYYMRVIILALGGPDPFSSQRPAWLQLLAQQLGAAFSQRSVQAQLEAGGVSWIRADGRRRLAPFDSAWHLPAHDQEALWGMMPLGNEEQISRHNAVQQEVLHAYVSAYPAAPGRPAPSIDDVAALLWA